MCIFKAGDCRRPTSDWLHLSAYSMCPVFVGTACAQCPAPQSAEQYPAQLPKGDTPKSLTTYPVRCHSQLPICSLQYPPCRRCSHRGGGGRGTQLPCSALTLNICFTLCRGRFTLSLCSSCRTSLMLRLPSPFLSASSNVCFSHFGAELGANTVHRPDLACSSLQPGRQGARVPSPSTPSYLPFIGKPYPGGEWRGSVPTPGAQGYWSLVRWRRARLSSSLMPAMR